MKKLFLIITFSFFVLLPVARAESVPVVTKVNAWNTQFVAPNTKIEIRGENFLLNRDGQIPKAFVDGEELQRDMSEFVSDMTWHLVVFLPENIAPGEHAVVVESSEKIKSAPFSFTVVSLCSKDEWSCDWWGACGANGQQTRVCTKIKECASVETPSPSISQSCVYVPPVYVPPVPVTPLPVVPSPSPLPVPVSPVPTVPLPAPIVLNPVMPSAPSVGIDNDRIVRSTVRLDCPEGTGSGTVISADGAVLTNRHMVEGGVEFCRIGFVNRFLEQPVYSEIGYTVKVADGIDAAILKIQHPGKVFTFMPIGEVDENDIQAGEGIKLYGYPGIGGQTMTVTEGTFSGIDGVYVKTDARMSGGNSGGGSYFLRSGKFVGMPTEAVWRIGQEVDKMNHILFVNNVIRWMKDGKFAVVQQSTIAKAMQYNWDAPKGKKAEVVKPKAKVQKVAVQQKVEVKKEVPKVVVPVTLPPKRGWWQKIKSWF